MTRTAYTDVLFWLKSSRGTDERWARRYKGKVTVEQIRDDLEEWVNNHPATQRSESYVTYGYRRIRIPPRRELLARWKRTCGRYEKAKAARDTVRAMLMAHEVKAL